MTKSLLFKGLILILLLSSLFLNIVLWQKLQRSQLGVLVIEVLDGDTVLLEGDVRLRLRSVDAPELNFCGGKEATDTLTGLVKGKRVVIREQILDQRGRPMALIYANDVFVNLEMLKSGWVRYHHDQTSKEEILRSALDSVKKRSEGIFSPRCYQKDNLENPNCRIKGNIDKNSGVKKYYYPGCAQYNFTIVGKDIGEQWFCTEKEAQAAGFVKADTCPNPLPE